MARKKRQIDPLPETDSTCKTEVLQGGARQGGKTEALKKMPNPGLVIGPLRVKAIQKADAERTKKNS